MVYKRHEKPKGDEAQPQYMQAENNSWSQTVSFMKGQQTQIGKWNRHALLITIT